MIARRIYLVGFMGAGKTTVGKILADEIGYTYIDLDAAIELVAGKSIQKIFSEDGEAIFRRFESEVLSQLQHKSEIVIATGGGCGAIRSNMQLMIETGTCIYLQAQPGVLFHRLAPLKSTRPLIGHLGDVDLMELILDLLIIREPVYRLAHFTVNSEKAPEEVSKEIISLMAHQSFSGLEARTS